MPPRRWTPSPRQIDFDHVSFKYNAKAEKNALSDITLHIPAGATVGIIGGTGAAKTTLVQLIPRCTTPPRARSGSAGATSAATT